MREDLPTDQGYDRWSTIYDDEDNALIQLETRHLPPLIGEISGLQVIDIGCGTGRHTVALAAAGAHVVGVDFSSGMLEKAKAKPNAEKVHWILADINKDLPLECDHADKVVCCLVLDHIADVLGLFKEMKRLCKESGEILISVMHPAMMLKGLQARFHDPATGVEVRPQSAPNEISDYVMAAVRAGLTIAHMSEHCVDEQLAQVSPRSRKYLDWPMLLLMKLLPSPIRS